MFDRTEPATPPAVTAGLSRPPPAPNSETTEAFGAGVAAVLYEKSWLRIAPGPEPLAFPVNSPTFDGASGILNAIDDDPLKVTMTEPSPLVLIVNGRIALIWFAETNSGMALKPSMVTVTFASALSRPPDAFMVKLTPVAGVAGPRLLPKIETIAPGENPTDR